MTHCSRFRPALGLVFAVGMAAAGVSACKVINPDHCANQALPGNEWCVRLQSSTPFCSPCIANFHGCVTFEPINCNDYDPAVFGGDGDDDGETESGSDG